MPGKGMCLELGGQAPSLLQAFFCGSPHSLHSGPGLSQQSRRLREKDLVERVAGGGGRIGDEALGSCLAAFLGWE